MFGLYVATTVCHGRHCWPFPAVFARRLSVDGKEGGRAGLTIVLRSMYVPERSEFAKRYAGSFVRFCLIVYPPLPRPSSQSAWVS